MAYGYRSNRNRYYARRPKVEKPPHLTDPALLERINALAASESADDWTRSFCTSIAEGFKKYKGLTQKQFDIFVKQEHRATPEFQAARDEWRANYDDNKRNIARICAEYYKANPPYFGDLASKVLNDPEFIPTPRQYKAMCENKYAKKVLNSALAEAAFAPGAMVLPRASAPWNQKKALEKGGVIIASDSGPIQSAAKGAKVYTILPLGSAETLQIQERHLKKMRGGKK